MPRRTYYTARYPRTLLANRIGGCVALLGVALVVAMVAVAVVSAAGLVPLAAGATFAWYVLPVAAWLLVVGGLLFAVTASHAY